MQWMSETGAFFAGERWAIAECDSSDLFLTCVWGRGNRRVQGSAYPDKISIECCWGSISNADRCMYLPETCLTEEWKLQVKWRWHFSLTEWDGCVWPRAAADSRYSSQVLSGEMLKHLPLKLGLQNQASPDPCDSVLSSCYLLPVPNSALAVTFSYTDLFSPHINLRSMFQNLKHYCES